MVPPYCGLPSLSHQLLVEATEEVVVGAVVTVLEVTMGVVVDIAVVSVVEICAEVEVGVEVLQDANIKDMTMLQVSKIQTIPRFT